MSAPSPSPGAAADAAEQACHDRYWRSTVRLSLVLLLLWAAVGLGCGVLLADWLDAFRLAGYPLGFWFAQQGSIIAFVLLILVYAVRMGQLDRRLRRDLERARRARTEARP